MAPVIGYWNLRGAVEPIILTLKQAKASYNLRVYKLGDAPDFDKSDWLNEKHNLGLPYPNLPYYIDGDLKITQVLFSTYFHSLWTAWYVESDQEFEDRRPGLDSYLVEKLNHTGNAFGSNKFILGDRVTFVDFLLYSTLDYIRQYKPSLLDPHANLKSYLDRIEALPEINKYLKSNSFSRFPITDATAKWGNDTIQKPY